MISIAYDHRCLLAWLLTGEFSWVQRRYNSYRGEAGKIADNALNREFTASAPNQEWVTDVTEFRINDRKVYFSPVMDLFDRQIIAYAVSDSPNLELTNS
ncbi:DDE-type integrase/transposase/recombinase, partial [Saccharopolyspora sp. NPDC000995]